MDKSHKRRTEITIETHSVTIIRTGNGSGLVLCDECGQPVRMLPAEQPEKSAECGVRSIGDAHCEAAQPQEVLEELPEKHSFSA